MATFDESQFLIALKTYLLATVDSGVLVHIVRDLDPLTWNNILPPCVVFKDGEQTVEDRTLCTLTYSIPIVVASQVPDEFGGVVVGRAPLATMKGVVYYSKMVSGLMQYGTMVDVISMSNTQLRGSTVVSIAPSEHVDAGEGLGLWQTKQLTVELNLRAL